MSAKEAVVQVLNSRRKPFDLETLRQRVVKLTKRNLTPESLQVTISNLRRRDNVPISRGPNYGLVS